MKAKIKLNNENRTLEILLIMQYENGLNIGWMDAFLASEESGMMTGAIIDFDQSILGCYDSPPHPAA